MTTKQKTVAVTGAYQGIGAAIANLFLERGYNVDALVSNAGIFFPKPLIEYTPEDFWALSSTNLERFIYTTQLATEESVS